MFRFLLIGMALASGGVAAWLVGSMGGDTYAGDLDASPAGMRMEEVLVVYRDREQGSAIDADDLQWATWPSEAVRSGFVRRADHPDAPEALAGSVARTYLVAGTPLMEQSLAPPKTSLLSAALSPGMRAVAIKVSAENTAGGFILPNDRVDVLLTARCNKREGCASQATVRTILRNVRVLAIDQSGDNDTSDNSLIGKTATLELSPNQAESLVGAEAIGDLALVLRASADNDAPAVDLEPESQTMRVRRGGVSEIVTVR